jgi:hypothetical protein
MKEKIRFFTINFTIIKQMLRGIFAAIIFVMINFTYTTAVASEEVEVPSISKNNSLNAQSLKQSDWWRNVQKKIREQEYHVTYQKKTSLPEISEAYQAPNRSQNLRTYFTEKGIKVIPRTEKNPIWNVGLKLDGVAKGDNIISLPEDKTPEVTVSRIEYHRGVVTEWYENRPEGLEQGFTVHKKIGGKGTLALILGINGNVKAVLSQDKKAVDFLTSSNVRVLRYSKLHVTDSSGKILPSHFEVAHNIIRIMIDDRSTVYPLTVDPLLTSPTWTVDGPHTKASLGFSVSTAGDVNGDNYSDVIIGAPGFDIGEENEGRAYIYHGSASGLNIIADWWTDGGEAGADFGSSVSTAGDVNKDGFSDVIIGSPGYDNGRGRAFVYYGSSLLGTLPIGSMIDRSTQPHAWFGDSVCTAGDVNGDGYSDVIIGAPGYDINNNEDVGKVYVFYGSGSDLGLKTDTYWSAESNQPSAYFGKSACTGGDVNGDGYSDVIIGAPGYDINNNEDVGKVYVFYGSGSDLGLDINDYWTEEGNQGDKCFGDSVGPAGDVDGDGFSDIIVGAPYYENDDGEVTGRVIVYYGSDSGLNGTLNWNEESDQTYAKFGDSVGTAGDVNGDGFSDIIVGAPAYNSNSLENNGMIFVYFGSASGLSDTLVLTSEGEQEDARFGESVTTAGDVNGDGFGDIIIGAPGYDISTDTDSDEGRVLVYYGSSLALNPTSNWTSESDQNHAWFGDSVSTAGDVNGDGFSDIIIGAPGYDNGQPQEGRAFVYHGSASGISTTINWSAESDEIEAYFGSSVATAGDVNGDGFSDVIVGAPLYDNNKGKVFLYYGSYSGLKTDGHWTATGDQIEAWFGDSVNTAGDVNGDGFSDIIIGAPGYDNGQEGQVFVYYGSEDGINEEKIPWSAESDQANAHFGRSVGTAGDVNGDSYSDIIIGAPFYHYDEYHQGRAFIYYGSSSGISSDPDWFADGDHYRANLGRSVATAGDVNRDGYSDVIIGGAPHDKTSYSGDGSVSVFYGSQSGLSDSPQWTLESDQEGAALGFSANTAGDVNGDGYSDIIVGAYLYDSDEDSDEHNEGRVFVYYGSASGLSGDPNWSEGDQNNTFYGKSTSTAGDVNGDGFSDIIVGAPSYRSDDLSEGEGGAFVYYGNTTNGKTVKPRQLKNDGINVISQLGISDEETSYTISARGYAPMGRSSIKLEWEIKPTGTSFDGRDTFLSEQWQTTEPGGYQFNEKSEELTGHTAYHWRVRFRYPPDNFMGQTASRWFLPFPATLDVTDLRTNNTPPIGGYTEDNKIPTLLVSQSRDGTGLVTIRFRIKDGGRNGCTLKEFNYSMDGGSIWKSPAEGDSSFSLGSRWPDNEGNLFDSAPDWSGQEHYFTFDTRHLDVSTDFEGKDQNEVRVRFKVNDGLEDSNKPTKSDNFRVDLQSPAVGSIIIDSNNCTDKIVSEDNSTTSDATPPLCIESDGADWMHFALTVDELSDVPWVAYNETYESVNISPGGNGDKTIWVEFKDEFGNIQDKEHASVQITYDTSPTVLLEDCNEDKKVEICRITHNPRPKWTWTSNGGTGIYRTKLDDDAWKNSTSETSYRPSSNLSDLHTLYVQEQGQTSTGDIFWSFEGKLEIEVDPGLPCSEAVSPIKVDDETRTFEITYNAYDSYNNEKCGIDSKGSGLARVDLMVKTKGKADYSLRDTDEGSDIDGKFEFTAEKEDTYLFYTVATDKAGNKEEAPDKDDPDKADTSTIYASQFSGYAIVLVGSLEEDEDGLKSHTVTAENVYKHLINRNFALIDDPEQRWNDPFDHIKYYNTYNDPDIDWDDEDHNEYNSEETNRKKIIEEAITKWALNKMKVLRGPLYIIMIDHGDKNKFFIDSEENYFTSSELSSWLDTLENGMKKEGINEDIIIILGTCYSGSNYSALYQRACKKINLSLT